MKQPDYVDFLRSLPSVDRLLSHQRGKALLERFARKFVVQHCRNILEDSRRKIVGGAPATPEELTDDLILSRVESAMQSEPRLRRVVNATGTILHSNLGRALLPQAAVDAIVEVASWPANLEYDLALGERGNREAIMEAILCDLTGAEAACVVNNNAAAVLLALNTLADGKEVIVSRGELVEIGGAFRIPDILAKSGAVLREVGTTNRTHKHDYEGAISEKTALLLKVHTSNYKIVGFTSDVSLDEIVAIGRKHQLPVVEDLGSGALVDLGEWGRTKEPFVAERIALGVDIVTFSGDKLLGGPQAGLIVGKQVWMDKIIRNPLHRALRCSKLIIAAMEATLRIYQQSPEIAEYIPTLRAITRPIADIDALGNRLLVELQSSLGEQFQVALEDSTSKIGSGALPIEEVPTKVIVIQQDGVGAERIAERFRKSNPPIIGRVKDNKFLLDLRTVSDVRDLIPQWDT